MFISRPEPPPHEARTGRPRIFTVRETAFDDMQSIDAAYWAGFLYADGSVTYKPRWAITLRLAERDRAHVEDFARFIGTDPARVCARTTKAHGAIRESRAALLVVGSRRLCGALGAWGIVPNKTKAPAEPAEMPRNVEIAFMRGLFDGNGCLSVNRRGLLQAAFCGNPDVVSWLLARIDAPASVQRRNITDYAQWSGHGRAVRVASLLYNAPGPVLQRKHAIARAFIDVSDSEKC